MYIRCADLHKFWCITACGDTLFNENSHMRKSVFPRMRICTVLSELPHVEIHKNMCKSALAEIRFSPCGNSHEIVHFHTWKYTKNCGFPNMRKYSLFLCISTSGNLSGKVNFRMSICKRIREFPRGKTCGNTRFFGDFHMRKYMRKCEFPYVEIHAERCNTACGNTLNQVKKK